MNALAKGRRLLVELVAVMSAFGAQATNYYWSGLGGDTDWSTVENWATDQALTKPASAVPGSNDYVYFCVNLYPDHQTTVTVSSPVTCGNIYLRDEISPGTVTIRGVSAGRVAFTPAVFSWKTAGKSGCGVVLHLENLEMVKNANIFSYTASDGNGIVFDNCELDMSKQPLTPPNGNGSLFVVRDSEFTYGNINYATTDSLTFAVTNSTMNGSSSINLRSGNGDYSIYGSTFRLAGEASFAGNNSGEGQNYPNERIRFVNSTLDLGNTARNFKCFSKGGLIEFDKVTVLGTFSGFGIADDGAVVVKDTALRATSTFAATGFWTLDNGEWIVTNSAYSAYATCSAAGVRYVIRGKKSRLMPGMRWQGAGKLSIDFVVPVGGYDRPPVGVDGVLTKYQNSLFNALSGGTIRVLPESPAARVDATAIYPLIYVYTGSTGKQVNLGACPPTGLPTAESGYCVSSVSSSVPFDEVNDQEASWWTPVDAGYSTSVAALGVKIVGHDSRIPQLGGLELTGLTQAGATFALTVDNIGEQPEGEKAASATPTLLVRPVGSQAWAEIPQAEIGGEGVVTLTTDKRSFPEAGFYECGARLVNSFGLSNEYVLTEPIEVNFTKPVLAELTFDGEGVETTVFGEVRGTGAGETALLKLEVSEDANFASGVTEYTIGSFAAGSQYNKTVPVNPGVKTYFRVTATAEGVSASVSGSDVSRTISTLGGVTAVCTNGFCRLVIDGTIVTRGAGVSTVKVRWSKDGADWETTTIGTVDADGGAFNGAHAFAMPDGTAYYQVVVENSSGGQTWTAEGEVVTTAVKNYSTFYWRDVDGEWNGSWNDGRHWYKPDFPDDVTLVPNHAGYATASFSNCPADGSEVIVTLDGDVSVGTVSSTTAGQRLTFTGELGTTVTTSMALNQQRSTNTFDKITWDSAKTELEAKEKLAYFLVNGAQLKLYRFFSRTQGVILYIGEDCTATLEREGQEGGGKEFIVDNGHFIHRGFVGQNSASGAVSYILRGKQAKVDFVTSATYFNATWKNTRFIFEIPVGGYERAPVMLTSPTDTGSFMRTGGAISPFYSGGEGCGLFFEVSPDSPILSGHTGRAIDQDLFVWNQTGWAFEAGKWDLHDATYLVVPERGADGKKVKGISLWIRGIDEVSYVDAKTLRATGTVAYAVSYHQDAKAGLTLNVR